MPKTALNDARLRSLPVPEKGQKDFWDSSLTGFGVRVSQGGSKTFVLNIDNSRRVIGRYGIITLSEARAEAKRILAERTLGRVRPELITFPRARDEFLEEKRQTRKPRTHAGLKRFLNLYFPFKGQITEATHGELTRRLNKITAPSEKNHAIAAAKVFFTWCAKKRYLTDNPTFGLSLTSRPARSRVLSDAELKSIWRACDDPDAELPEHFRTIVKLLMLSGQRRGEISGLKGEYISDATCTLPGALTKNGRGHIFPLGPLARSIVADVVPTPNSGLLFPARGKPASPFNGWGKSKAELDRVSSVMGWTLHDLRRTFATGLAEMGTPIHVVEKLLNHISGTTGGLVGVYQRHQYWDEQVIAVAGWDARLHRLLNT
jgi:integrase